MSRTLEKIICSLFQRYASQYPKWTIQVTVQPGKKIGSYYTAWSRNLQCSKCFAVSARKLAAATIGENLNNQPVQDSDDPLANIFYFVLQFIRDGGEVLRCIPQFDSFVLCPRFLCILCGLQMVAAVFGHSLARQAFSFDSLFCWRIWHRIQVGSTVQFVHQKTREIQIARESGCRLGWSNSFRSSREPYNKTPDTDHR